MALLMMTRRRDLTINALYYDTVEHTLIDKMNGQADVAARIIRVIGVPADRYREDPVRMLRVVRFAARLKFDIEASTQSAIAETGTLLRDIPPARLFDEWLKLFMNGFSAPTCALLREHGLLKHLMGNGVEDALNASVARQLQHQAMTNTDRRVAEERPVTPAFCWLHSFGPPPNSVPLNWRREANRPFRQCSAGRSGPSLPASCHPQALSRHARHLGSATAARTASTQKIKDLLSHRWFRAAFDLRLLRERQRRQR